jgi:hypothetical protein
MTDYLTYCEQPGFDSINDPVDWLHGLLDRLRKASFDTVLETVLKMLIGLLEL